MPVVLSSGVRERSLGSGHFGSDWSGIWSLVFEGSTYSHNWPVVAIDMTISGHDIQSSGFFRVILDVDTVVEAMLER